MLTVSEERGSIAVFAAGKMVALDSADAAASHICEHARKSLNLGSSDANERGIRRYPFQIGASLAAAVILWAGVTLPSVQVVERSLDVAIDYLTPANLALVGTKPMAPSCISPATSARSTMSIRDASRSESTFRGACPDVKRL